MTEDGMKYFIDKSKETFVGKTGSEEISGQKTFCDSMYIAGVWNSLNLKNTNMDTDSPPTDNWIYKKLIFQDVNDNRIGELACNINIDGSHDIVLRSWFENSTKYTNGYTSFTIKRLVDGTAYATAPSWNVGTADNSDKIVTTYMVNSLPSLVHTSGNETIAGTKTFTGTVIAPATTDSSVDNAIVTKKYLLDKIATLEARLSALEGA